MGPLPNGRTLPWLKYMKGDLNYLRPSWDDPPGIVFQRCEDRCEFSKRVGLDEGFLTDFFSGLVK